MPQMGVPLCCASALGLVAASEVAFLCERKLLPLTPFSQPSPWIGTHNQSPDVSSSSACSGLCSRLPESLWNDLLLWQFLLAETLR